MKRLTFLLLALVAGLLTPPAASHASSYAGSKKPFPVTLVDDQGSHVTITSRPKRIITLYSAYTETVFALGLEKRLVGDASQYAEGATGVTTAAGKPRDFRYPAEWPSRLGLDYPIRSVQLPHVEGGFGQTQFNLETMTSLRPDLVLAPYYKSQVPTFQKMKDLGFKVLFLNPSNIAGVLHDITLVGEAAGARKQAATLVKTMKGELSTVKLRMAKVTNRPRVFYELDATNPTQPITAGPKTVIDEAIGLAHGKNIADSVTSCSGTQCYPAFSLEALVAADPQVIVLSDAAYGTKSDDVKARPGWSTVSAVRLNKIYAFNPDVLSRFGPRVVIGVRDLAKLLHPQAFRG
ncbi:MAG TPA: ABC transporter substrate-binding protein [Chloroflexota bacterium]